MSIHTRQLFGWFLAVLSALLVNGRLSAQVEKGSATGSDGTIRVYLDDESAIVGKIPSGKKLVFKTEIGELSIPMAKLVGLEVAEDNSKSKLTLSNGDRLTGELVGETLSITAKWGTVEVDMARVKKIFAKTLPSGYVLEVSHTHSKAEGGGTITKSEVNLVRRDRRTPRGISGSRRGGSGFSSGFGSSGGASALPESGSTRGSGALPPALSPPPKPPTVGGARPSTSTAGGFKAKSLDAPPIKSGAASKGDTKDDK